MCYYLIYSEVGPPARVTHKEGVTGVFFFFFLHPPSAVCFSFFSSALYRERVEMDFFFTLRGQELESFNQNPVFDSSFDEGEGLVELEPCLSCDKNEGKRQPWKKKWRREMKGKINTPVSTYIIYLPCDPPPPRLLRPKVIPQGVHLTSKMG